MILVFGKTGQVARELQLIGNVKAIGRDHADISNPKICEDVIRSYSPKAVINAAAYTKVDMAEKEENLATKINGDAPIVMANTCADLGICFVHISTDYVFDGSGKKPWSENDKTSPLGAYGRSKLIGEQGIKASKAVYAILRTSWVFSSHGKNFLKTMLNLSENHNKLEVVSDQIGGPTPANEIAKTCLKIVDELQLDSSKSDIYHYSGKPDVSWAEFANEIFNQSRRKVKLSPILTSDYPTPASRPINSRMDCRNIENAFGIKRPDWRNGLSKILKELEILA